MSRIYFIRHGETDANHQGLMCGGKWDLQLNETGRAQAREAAQKIFSLVPDLESVCSSPLLRARETPMIIASNFDLESVIIDEFAKGDIGSLDRVSFESVKVAFLGDGEPEGGETRAQLRLRIRAAFERCQQFEAPVLIVSHGAVWLALRSLLEMPPLKVANALPYEIFRDTEGRWQARAL